VPPPSPHESQEIGGVNGRVAKSAGAPAGSKKDALALDRCRRFRGTSSAIGLRGWHGDAHRELSAVTSGQSVRAGLCDSDGDGDGGADELKSKLDIARRR
jgi:hypothetical protein